MPKLTESAVEKPPMQRIEKQGYTYLPGPEIAPVNQTDERESKN